MEKFRRMILKVVKMVYAKELAAVSFLVKGN